MRAGIAGLIGSIVLALLFAVSASAATVQASGTEDLPPTITPQASTISVRDPGAEANALTMSLVGPDSGRVRYSVRDSAAPLTAGPGCAGGGPPGSEVTCLLPLSRAASNCHRTLCLDGGRSVSFRIELGGGINSFDASSMPVRDGGTGLGLGMTVIGGSESDTITTGATHDFVDPGPGADVLHTGDGYDNVHATQGPADAGDLFDLGAGTADTVTYGESSEPLELSLDGVANDGAAGEGDNLVDVEILRAGPADDVVVGSELGDTLIGGDGEDRIAGEGGDDQIDGFDDDDRLRGGAGDDDVSGSYGADRITGLAGDDGLHGDQGDDRVVGGRGDDVVHGDPGADRVFGNSGTDHLQASYPSRADEDPDRLDCGRGADRARVEEALDRTRHCESFAGPDAGGHDRRR
jgi:hypothetical protein